MALNTRETLKKIIKEEIQTIVNNEDLSVNYNFIITDDFNKHEDILQGNEVFVVIKFSPATLSYQSGVYPATINVICNQNYTQEILGLFTKFAETYNLNKGVRTNNYIIQSYTTPSANQYFVDYDANFGVVCYFSAGFSVSPNISAITKVEIDDEELPFINFSWMYSNSADAVSRPSDNNAYSESVMQYGTNGLSMSLYFNLENDFISELVEMADKTKSVSQDKAYSMALTFSNSTEIDLDVKIQNFVISQSQDGLPIIQISITQ